MADWLGRLSAFLPGADQLSEQERMALIRQGLLATGAGILANNTGNYGKAGPAIGAGVSQGLLAMNKGADQLADNKASAQQLALQTGDPAELRAFNAMIKDLTPEQQKQALLVHLGLQGRASNAGFGFDMVPDANGVPRPQRRNPRTGEIEVFSDEASQWIPLGSGAQAPASPDGASAPNPRADFLGLADKYGANITSLFRTPAHNKAVGGVPNSQHMNGTAGDFVVPPEAKAGFIAEAKGRGYEVIDEGDHVHLELPTFKPAPVPGLGRGRRKEDEAGAVKAAEFGAQINALPAIGAIEADNAGKRAAAEAAGKSGAEAQFNLPKVEESASMMLTAIRDLKNDPALKSVVGLNGKFNPAVYVPGTPEQATLARIKQINGQAFLQAYQTLRGGGQITEVEGQKATEAMGRLDRAQSYDDYIGALNDLESVISGAANVARQQAGGGQSAPGAVRRYNPATGKIE